MKPRSKKAKGRRLQNYIANIIVDMTNLSTHDVKPAVMGESGMDIKLSKEAQLKFPFAIEAKNVEKLNIWQAIEQAERNKKDLIPMVVFKRNNSKIYACLEFEKLVELLYGNC